jgi:hypothetical protein
MKKIITVGIAVLSVAACGSTKTTPVTMVASPPNGVTISAPNGKMSVTPTHVVDSARFLHLRPETGKRFVDAAFKIVGISGAYSDDDTYSDVVVIGSDGRIYKSGSNSITGCTIGSFQVTRRRKLVGCVIFEVPNGVKVKRIRWSMSGTNATWNLK